MRRSGCGVLERHARVRAGDALHETEVDDLGDVEPAAALAQQDVGGLHVAVDEARAVGFAQRLAHLAQHVDDTARRHGPVAPDQLLEVDTVEVLHGVVEEAVWRPAVVVDRDGVRRSQL